MKTSTRNALWRIALLPVLGLSLSGAVGAAQQSYIVPDDVALSALLAPPPAVDSAAGKRDLAEVLAVQVHRTPAQVTAALADLQKSVFRFNDVMGPDFAADKLPKTAALFAAINHDAAQITDAGKDYFHRARPVAVSDAVHPIVPTKAAGLQQSYPSGHATMGYLDAIVLANMFPEKRAALFERGRQFGENRVIDGVHFPSDIEASRINASLIAAALFNDALFVDDFNAARSEARQALGLK